MAGDIGGSRKVQRPARKPVDKAEAWSDVKQGAEGLKKASADAGTQFAYWVNENGKDVKKFFKYDGLSDDERSNYAQTLDRGINRGRTRGVPDGDTARSHLRGHAKTLSPEDYLHDFEDRLARIDPSSRNLSDRGALKAEFEHTKERLADSLAVVMEMERSVEIAINKMGKGKEDGIDAETLDAWKTEARRYWKAAFTSSNSALADLASGEFLLPTGKELADVRKRLDSDPNFLGAMQEVRAKAVASACDTFRVKEGEDLAAQIGQLGKRMWTLGRAGVEIDKEARALMEAGLGRENVLGERKGLMGTDFDSRANERLNDLLTRAEEARAVGLSVDRQAKDGQPSYKVAVSSYVDAVTTRRQLFDKEVLKELTQAAGKLEVDGRKDEADLFRTAITDLFGEKGRDGKRRGGKAALDRAALSLLEAATGREGLLSEGTLDKIGRLNAAVIAWHGNAEGMCSLMAARDKGLSKDGGGRLPVFSREAMVEAMRIEVSSSLRGVSASMIDRDFGGIGRESLRSGGDIRKNVARIGDISRTTAEQANEWLKRRGQAERQQKAVASVRGDLKDAVANFRRKMDVSLAHVAESPDMAARLREAAETVHGRLKGKFVDDATFADLGGTSDMSRLRKALTAPHMSEAASETLALVRTRAADEMLASAGDYGKTVSEWIADSDKDFISDETGLRGTSVLDLMSERLADTQDLKGAPKEFVDRLRSLSSERIAVANDILGQEMERGSLREDTDEARKRLKSVTDRLKGEIKAMFATQPDLARDVLEFAYGKAEARKPSFAPAYRPGGSGGTDVESVNASLARDKMEEVLGLSKEGAQALAASPLGKAIRWLNEGQQAAARLASARDRLAMESDVLKGIADPERRARFVDRVLGLGMKSMQEIDRVFPVGRSKSGSGHQKLEGTPQRNANTTRDVYASVRNMSESRIERYGAKLGRAASAFDGTAREGTGTLLAAFSAEQREIAVRREARAEYARSEIARDKASLEARRLRRELGRMDGHLKKAESLKSDPKVAEVAVRMNTVTSPAGIVKGLKARAEAWLTKVQKKSDAEIAARSASLPWAKRKANDLIWRFGRNKDGVRSGPPPFGLGRLYDSRYQVLLAGRKRISEEIETTRQLAARYGKAKSVAEIPKHVAMMATNKSIDASLAADLKDFGLRLNSIRREAAASTRDGELSPVKSLIPKTDDTYWGDVSTEQAFGALFATHDTFLKTLEQTRQVLEGRREALKANLAKQEAIVAQMEARKRELTESVRKGR